jgi:transmembrane sensor
MPSVSGTGLSRSRNAAATWVVKLSAAQAGESDWLAFESWLDAGPDHRKRYDEALAVWLEMDAAAPEALSADLERRFRRRFEPRPAATATPTLWWAAGSVAALALITVSASVTLRPQPRADRPAAVYETARGERRTVTLPDGSTVTLSGDTQVLARLDDDRRDLTLARGEAAFRVVHNAARPFTIEVGDRQVRDLGTQFDVRRGPADVAVTVRQGLVQVGPAPGGSGDTVDIGAGRRLTHQDGEAGSKVETVAADESFAWTSGRLIYRDRPLREVVEDLNRYLPHTVRIADERTAELRFTGVLKVDAEAPTLARLAVLLPVSATRDNGAIILQVRGEPR